MHRTDKHIQLVYTRKDRCRMCYTCVRECPVKAIRIMNGQAEVISERCIGCGNCVKVCSQEAKAFLNLQSEVLDVLERRDGRKNIAVIAPSFPAEFTEVKDYKVVVGMLRKLGFDHVLEVSYGADVVAKKYGEVLDNAPEESRYISSDCPAIVNYIRYYHPGLVKNLAPIASPMVAIARIARKKYGENARIVFIGPCIAKKSESYEVDLGITFQELRGLFEARNITAENITPTEFDPPHSGKGAIFPVSRGLLQTVGKKDDITEGNVMVAEGKTNFLEAIREFEKGLINTRHLELLCCEGCIMGPGMTSCSRKYERIVQIGNYVREKLQNVDPEEQQKNEKEFADVALDQQFRAGDKRVASPDRKRIEEILVSMGKNTPKDHLNCGACGYATCVEHAEAIVEGLAETEMCLPYTIEKLHQSIDELNLSNENLASARQALKQSEKLASMGQLSAGIAHELNNPLGVITMYSNILKDEAPQGDPVHKDLDLIVEQAERCKKIVGGLLNFARKNQVVPEETDMVGFIRHSIESLIHNGKIKFEVKHSDPRINAMIDRDQLSQVMTNLGKNAIEAMPEGGTLTLSVEDEGEHVRIRVGDTGHGIKKEHMEKIFTPFFTTKEIGKGTGLGLPLIYGIVKMHKGQIAVDSNADPEKGQTGTTFTITIPKKSENIETVKNNEQ